MGFITDVPAIIGGPLVIGWLANNVYKIDVNDPVEGASPTSSFAGLGVSNAQANVLAGRTTVLHNALQSFAASFVFGEVLGALGRSRGHLTLPVSDSSVLTFQWGFIPVTSTGISTGSAGLIWHVPFVQSVSAMFGAPTMIAPAAGPLDAVVVPVLASSTLTTGQFAWRVLDANIPGSISWGITAFAVGY